MAITNSQGLPPFSKFIENVPREPLLDNDPVLARQQMPLNDSYYHQYSHPTQSYRQHQTSQQLQLQHQQHQQQQYQYQHQHQQHQQHHQQLPVSPQYTHRSFSHSSVAAHTASPTTFYPANTVHLPGNDNSYTTGPSHSHSNSLPAPNLVRYNTEGNGNGRGNYGPHTYHHHHNNSTPSSFYPATFRRSSVSTTNIPVNFQFPKPTNGPGQLPSKSSSSQHQLIKNGNGQVKQSEISHTTWNPEVSMMSMMKTIPLFKEIVDALSVIQDAFNTIHNKSINHPPVVNNRLEIDGKILNIDYIKELLLSIPPSLLYNLESYLNSNLKFVQLLRQDQSNILRDNEIKSQNLRPQDVQDHSISAYQFPSSPTRYLMNQIMESPGHQPVHNHPQQNKRHKSASTIPSSSVEPVKKSKSSTKSPENVDALGGKFKRIKKKSSLKFDAEKRPKSPSECKHCLSDTTPEWRRGPDGDKTLCNACGIFYAKLIKKFQSPVEAAKVMTERKLAGNAHDRHV